MTGLLVSVRDADEAIEALAGGADLIDIKEPKRGALGSADPDVWHDVQRVAPVDFPLSVALGELVDNDVAARAARVPHVQYAKVGLAGCLDQADWQQRWRTVLARLPSNTRRVAVAYADHRVARAPTPQEILHAAPAAGCAALLLDTFGKQQGDLFAHFGEGELATLARQCRETGMALALAGSLNLMSLERALSIEPALIAVRGAACAGGRNGRVRSALVKQIKARISANSPRDLISN